MQRILLRTLGFVLLLCTVSASGAWAQQPASSAAQAGSPARQRLLAQELVPQQPARYAWIRAAEAQGQGADALYLRLALLDEWLLALEGRPAQVGRTIEVAIAHGREVDADDLQRRARAVWPSLLKAQLRPLWDMDGPDVPLPSELDALGADSIAPEGPGLWVHRAKDGRPRGLYLWLGVRNGLGEPVPLPEFALRLGRPGQQAAAPLMQCYLPRYSTRQLIPPQSTQHYLCRAGEGGFGLPPTGVGWLAQMGEWFSQGASLQTELPQHDQALSRTGRILGQVDNPAVDDFLRGAREATEKQQQLQKERAQAEAAAAKKAREATPARRSGESLPLWLKRVAFLGGVVGALVLYVLLAHHVSVAVASGVLWFGLAIPSAIYLRSIWTMGGTDGWGKLVAIVLSGAAIAAPFVGTLAAYTVYKLVVSARARRKAILFLLGVIVVIVLHALERWLFW
ncbi:hypothetical protein [Acidovorax sp. JMULE5]|uniref:hypothetical protein n=1 Tax=Acidovorax sp. JMULE5 TaxID=2518343 RepID=UPI0021043A36|nr:hypothetical protein [Acidovorax sp. JMULE5]